MTDLEKAFEKFHEERRIALWGKIEQEHKKRVAGGMVDSMASLYDTKMDVFTNDPSTQDRHIFEAGWNAALKTRIQQEHA